MEKKNDRKEGKDILTSCSHVIGCTWPDLTKNVNNCIINRKPKEYFMLFH